jgi:segregation and condensation protein B
LNEEQIKSAIESILFVAGDAVELRELAVALETDEVTIARIAGELAEQKQEAAAGVLIKRVGNKLQLCSNPEYMMFINRVLQPIKKTRLSQSMLETLAIIAYKQPVTRFEIEQIRGVQCNYSVATLVEKGLVVRTGRKKALGNPMLYGTSDEFLRHFGISSLDELPRLREAE